MKSLGKASASSIPRFIDKNKKKKKKKKKKVGTARFVFLTFNIKNWIKYKKDYIFILKNKANGKQTANAKNMEKDLSSHLSFL
jgi:hypothetical protein